MQVTWEAVRRASGDAALDSTNNAQRHDRYTSVFVGIQQMEYGNLAGPHLHTISPFSGKSFLQASVRHHTHTTAHLTCVQLLAAAFLWQPVGCLSLMGSRGHVLASTQLAPLHWSQLTAAWPNCRQRHIEGLRFLQASISCCRKPQLQRLVQPGCWPWTDVAKRWMQALMATHAQKRAQHFS